MNHFTFRDFIHALGVKADRPITTASTMGDAISSAGFINIHVHDYKAPVGNRAKHKTYKDAGKVTMEMWKTAFGGVADLFVDEVWGWGRRRGREADELG